MVIWRVGYLQVAAMCKGLFKQRRQMYRNAENLFELLFILKYSTCVGVFDRSKTFLDPWTQIRSKKTLLQFLETSYAPVQMLSI